MKKLLFYLIGIITFIILWIILSFSIGNIVIPYPWEILKNFTSFLMDNGIVIASIPNIRHYTTIFNIVFNGYWPYRDRGIHDKTHLRFFTFRNIKEIFQNAGLKIVRVKRNYRIIENKHPLNKYARFFAFPIFKDFLTFQYLIVAKKS